MLQDIVHNLPGYMLVGIVIVVGISQLSRVIGAILGVLFWCAVALVGNFAYDMNGALGVGGYAFSREVFFLVCGAFALFHVATAFAAYQQRRRAKMRQALIDDDDD